MMELKTDFINTIYYFNRLLLMKPSKSKLQEKMAKHIEDMNLDNPIKSVYYYFSSHSRM